MTWEPSFVARVVGYLGAAALAIGGVEGKRPRLTAVFKPLTTIVLFTMVGVPETTFQWIVELGFLLSLVGDVALLWNGDTAFKIGLVGFLLAHVSYVIAFISVGAWSWHVAPVGVLFAASTSWLLKTLWPGAGAVRIPVAVYGLAITAMVTSASATLGGTLAWPLPAFSGAVLFYISDSSLSLDKFHKPIPHASLLTMGVYWLGQLGIALAARGSL